MPSGSIRLSGRSATATAFPAHVAEQVRRALFEILVALPHRVDSLHIGVEFIERAVGDLLQGLCVADDSLGNGKVFRSAAGSLHLRLLQGAHRHEGEGFRAAAVGALGRLAAEFRRVSAVFGRGGRLSVCAARECALRIPEDISFAGYDGIPITQALKPALTTVRQDTEEMGRLAARHLVRLVREPSKASRLPAILPVELIEGGTIADI